MDHLLLLSALAIGAGLALLVWGADRFVHGAAATARNLGVPPLIVGLTIVGFGTSAPEMLVSIVAAAQGNPALAVGNAVGSNITNIGLVLGATALTAPLRVRSGTLRREFPMAFLITLVTLLLMLDGALSRWDGIILLSGLGLMAYWMVTLGRRANRRDPLENEFEQEIPVGMSTTHALLWVVIGLALLLISSRALVWGAVNLAHAFGVSDLVIGLTVVAIGTSLPELAASVMSALKREPDIALGNVLGSNMFNMLAVIGFPALISPLRLDAALLERDMPIMIGLSIALFVMAYGFRGDGRITRWNGAILIAAYLGYLVLLYFTAAA